MIRKTILSCIAATSLIFFSTQAFALVNFSVGVPLSHTFTGKYNDGSEVESDGVSGTFVQIGVPILPGIGMDNYKEIKSLCKTPLIQILNKQHNNQKEFNKLIKLIIA